MQVATRPSVTHTLEAAERVSTGQDQVLERPGPAAAGGSGSDGPATSAEHRAPDRSLPPPPHRASVAKPSLSDAHAPRRAAPNTLSGRNSIRHGRTVCGLATQPPQLAPKQHAERESGGPLRNARNTAALMAGHQRFQSAGNNARRPGCSPNRCGSCQSSFNIPRPCIHSHTTVLAADALEASPILTLLPLASVASEQLESTLASVIVHHRVMRLHVVPAAQVCFAATH